MTAAGIYVFLSNWCSGTVVVIDTITNRVVKNISGVGVQPGAIGTSADGSSVYVTNCGSGPTPDNLSIISVVSLTITHVFHGVGGCSEKMGVAPNGTVVWLPNAVGVGEVSLTTGAILTTVTTTGGAKNELAITPDGSYLYAATTYTANISAINTATLTASNYRVTGASIGALTTSANGSYVYLADTGFNVSNAGFDTWSTTTHGLVHWINSTNFTGAQGMVRNPNGSYVVESNCGQPTDINVVNVLMNKVVESATLGHYGYDCAPRDAITLNGSFVYTIVGRNNLAAFVAVTQLSNPIDTTLYVSWKFPAGTLISGHVYVYDANCNNPLRTIALAASTEITVVTGLKPGTKYGFEVTANTSAGESTRSYCIGATTLGGSVTPGPSPKPAPGPTPPGPVIPATVIVTFLGLAVWQWFTVTMIVGLLLLLVSWARSRDRGGRSFRRGGD